MTWPDPCRRPGHQSWLGAHLFEFTSDYWLHDLFADPWEQAHFIEGSSPREAPAILREALVRRMTAIGDAVPRFVDALARNAGPAGQLKVSAAAARQ